ncbi:MAG: MGMT family protein [Pseudomonadota bacterium]
MAARTGGKEAAPPVEIARAITEITALLDGEAADLSKIPCDLSRVDPFAVKVYDATRAIPAGRTSTYGAIAVQLGDKTLARNVGQALGRNPVPIIVPCHRVVGAGGKLVGFSADGGVETKLKMLAIEGAAIGEPPGLFDTLPLATKPRR